MFHIHYIYSSIIDCVCFFNRKPSYDTETDPSEGLMNVLKKIYEDGDDDRNVRFKLFFIKREGGRLGKN